VPFEFADARGAVKRLRVLGMSSDKFNITFFDINTIINTVQQAHADLAEEAASKIKPTDSGMGGMNL
jgi:hypothetical protein